MVDWEEAKLEIARIFAEKEAGKQAQEGIELTAQDLTQLFEKIMKPQDSYEVITKDIKTANLDKNAARTAETELGIAKDFVIYRDVFDLNEDKWVQATIDSITADAAIKASVSQGIMAKLLDTFVTMKRESRVISALEKNKGLIFK